MSGVPRGRTGSFWSEGVGDRGLGPGRKLWALSEWPFLAWGQPQVEHGDCWTLAWGCPLPGPQGSIQCPRTGLWKGRGLTYSRGSRFFL